MRVIADKETLWTTRARQHLLKEGDDNTKFFHGMANSRRRKNAINVIEDDDRSLYRKEKKKRKYFYNKFKEVFALGDTTCTMIGD